MPADITIRGADQLALLSRRIKETGNGGLRRDLLRGIQRAAKPLKGVAQKSALDNLPHTGGLNEVVASSKFGVRTRTSGNSPGVRVVAVSGHDIESLDKRGQLRHPVFGNRDVWVSQQVRPGWFTAALAAQAPAVRVQIIAAMQLTASRL